MSSRTRGWAVPRGREHPKEADGVPPRWTTVVRNIRHLRKGRCLLVVDTSVRLALQQHDVTFDLGKDFVDQALDGRGLVHNFPVRIYQLPQF